MYLYSTAISSPLNAWHHFVGIIGGTNQSNMSIYIDGILSNGIAGPNNGTFYQPTQNSWYIGADTSGSVNSLWNGLLDDVRIYNRALSASEVQALYNAEK
jgi:hypothetical protein